jgi:hypothetical protein
MAPRGIWEATVVRATTTLLWIACWSAVACAPVSAADRVEEFKQVKRELVQLLRSKAAPDRTEAIKRLQKFPIEEAVRMLHGALGDPDPGVCQGAYAALLEMNGNLEVCETLLQVSRRAILADHGGVAAAAPVSILLASKLQSTQQDVEQLLEQVCSSRNGAAAIIALVDQLAARHEPGDVIPLVQLTKTRLFETQFGVRRTIVYALAQIRTKDALGALIDIMDRVGGEAKADAAEHLIQVTGQIFATDAAAWKRWWSEARESFEYPSGVARRPYRTTLTESESGYYYGMPMFAERMVFVMDISGSMAGRQILAAKRELTHGINSLPEDAHFGIVVFEKHVRVWQRELVPADTKHKQAAIAFVESQSTGSATASYDALEAAFAFDTEAIYFLSDGAPTAGKILAPVDIVAAITGLNQARRISVYTIGIGAGFPGSPLDEFLRTLADKNLGLYRRVDN